LNEHAHFNVVKDAWNFLKYFLIYDHEDSLRRNNALPKEQVENALRYFYEYSSLGWKTHNSHEISDPSGISPLKEKVYYINCHRNTLLHYESKKNNFYENVKKIDPRFNPLTNDFDQVGYILGYQSVHIDNLEDTWAYSYIIETIGFLLNRITIRGKFNTIIDSLNLAAEIAGAFNWYTLVWILCRLFGGCGDWPVPGDMIPDIPNIPQLELIPYSEGPYYNLRGNNLTSMWHFINMMPVHWAIPDMWEIGNHSRFNDHDGYYFDDGLGSDDEMLWSELAWWFDFSLIPIANNDVCDSNRRGPAYNYQFQQSDDDHPETRMQSPHYFGSQNIMDTVFSPVDNLAKYGWDKWKSTRDIFYLGHVLHAVLDASSAHHTVCTLGHNHKEYEDFVDNYYDSEVGRLSEPLSNMAVSLSNAGLPVPIYTNMISILGQDINTYNEIWKEIIFYKDIINEFWQRDNTRKEKSDIPIRNIITKIAERTYEHSLDHDLFMDNPEKSKWFDHARYVLYQSIAVSALVIVYAANARS